MRKLGKNSTLIPITLIAVGFALLYFVPNVLRKTNFKLEGTPDKKEHQLPTFPVSERLPVIQQGASKYKVGSKITLAELLKDGPIIVNFWATWCPPCIDEFPSLNLFAEQLHRSTDKSLPRLITISVDDAAKDVQAFYRTLDYRPEVLVLHDPGGALSKQVGTTKFPETYLLTAGGKATFKWVGPQDWLSNDVLKRLAQAP